MLVVAAVVVEVVDNETSSRPKIDIIASASLKAQFDSKTLQSHVEKVRASFSIKATPLAFI